MTTAAVIERHPIVVTLALPADWREYGAGMIRAKKEAGRRAVAAMAALRPDQVRVRVYSSHDAVHVVSWYRA